jgi:hypothetical protein
LDIDSIAEHLHRTKAPTAPVPSKQEAPVDFISPVVVSVVVSVVVLLKQIQPVRQDGLALRRVQSLEAQLKEAQAKLAEAEAGKLTSVRSAASPARSAGHKRDSSALGSTPKRRAKARATPPQASGQLKLATVFASQTASPRDVEEDHISEFSDEKSPITNCPGINASVRSYFEAVSAQRYF